MCEHGTEIDVEVTVPADLSHTGAAHTKRVGIDACIAAIVAALEAGGVLMRGSCCGHGTTHGSIELADGRTLLVLDSTAALDRVRTDDAERWRYIRTMLDTGTEPADDSDGSLDYVAVDTIALKDATARLGEYQTVEQLVDAARTQPEGSNG